jgi:hypothetical protein
VQWLLCAASRRHAYSDDEPRPVPRVQVPRKDGAGVPSALGQLPDHWHDGVTAYRDPEWRPKVARRVFVAVVAAAAYSPVGRGTQFFFLLFFGGVRLTFLRKPTNHLDLEGLDALMLALGTWNGGVIVISHDERFITSVAKEVRGRWLSLICHSDALNVSSGCAETVQLQSLKAMWKPIRSVGPHILRNMPTNSS